MGARAGAALALVALGVLAIAFLRGGACGAEPDGVPVALPEVAPADAPWSEDGPYRFSDATEAAGLAGFQQLAGSPEKPFLVETVGGGCALFDHDRDGDLDAYLSNGGRLGQPLTSNPADALYLNDGHGRFTDGSRAAGIDERRWTNGVRVCDADGDGLDDLYLTNYGRNTFYAADGRGAYVDRTDEAGLAVDSWSTGACYLDFDRDGDLDLHVANYVLFEEEKLLAERPTTVFRGVEVMKGPRGLPGAPDRFFVNEGALRFREASSALGLADEAFGFQDLAFDFDLDGWIDLFVGNDSVANNLWHNLEGERFEDVALRQGLAFSLDGRPQACMGAALGDFDGDLRPDLYVTNFDDDYSTLYRGEERGFFLDVSQALGLAAPTLDKLGWGTGFVDLDLDGDLELFAVNGHVYPQVDRFNLGTSYRQPVQLFEWTGTRFREPPGRGGQALAARRAGRGAALGDVDGDGDLDLLIEDLDGPPRLLRNDGPVGRRLEVVLVGAGANRAAVGARVVARAGGRAQLRLAGMADGFLSSSDPTLVFGLGSLAEVDELEVTWPLGKVERFGPLPGGTRVTVTEGANGADGRLTVAKR